jgi:hypothetical protein
LPSNCWRATFRSIIVGWTEPIGGRPYLGALRLGYYDQEGRLIYTGREAAVSRRSSRLTAITTGADTWRRIKTAVEQLASTTPPGPLH